MHMSLRDFKRVLDGAPVGAVIVAGYSGLVCVKVGADRWHRNPHRGGDPEATSEIYYTTLLSLSPEEWWVY